MGTGGVVFEHIVTVTLNPAIDRTLEVPGFRIGGHQPGRLVSRTPAGKGINVSRALAQLGVSNTALGFVGLEESELYETFLESCGVRSQLLSVPGRTRENITLIDPTSHVESHIRDVGFSIGETELVRLRKKLKLLCGPGVLVIFSGSCPPGLKPAHLLELVGVCIESGGQVAVDTSGTHVSAIRNVPLWLAKPNRQELGELVGQPMQDDASILDVGRQLSKTFRALIVSCGAAGGYLFIDGSAMLGQVTVDLKRVVNTVGCGDCLLAGFVAGQVQGRSVRDSYKFGLAVATAAAVSRDSGTFELDDVAAFESAVSVESVGE